MNGEIEIEEENNEVVICNIIYIIADSLDLL